MVGFLKENIFGLLLLIMLTWKQSQVLQLTFNVWNVYLLKHTAVETNQHEAEAELSMEISDFSLIKANVSLICAHTEDGFINHTLKWPPFF